MGLRSKTAAARACALALAAGSVVGAGCGEKGHEKDPTREGLALPLEGIEYNVFITRQLNTKIPPDSAYYHGPEAPKGETFYGVFLQACNKGKRPRRTTEHFEIVDNQGNKFEPIELPEDNEFAYAPQLLDPHECIPESGSVAQQGPAAGSMLLYKLPLGVTENRPLELEIKAPTTTEHLTVELDI
jgi:hypothetical protein